MIIILFLEEMHLVEVKNKFSEVNLFYKYLVQKRVVVVNKRKMIIILQKLRNK